MKDKSMIFKTLIFLGITLSIAILVGSFIYYSNKL